MLTSKFWLFSDSITSKQSQNAHFPMWFAFIVHLDYAKLHTCLCAYILWKHDMESILSFNSKQEN